MDRSMGGLKIVGHRGDIRIVGHRGARGLAPENTLAAIRKGMEHGVDELEVDIRVSSDGVAFLHHDPTVRGVTGEAMEAHTHTFEDLLRIKPDLATLEQAISTVDRRVPLQLEVKWGERTAPIIAVVESFLARGWQPGDFLFGSKKQATLLELHQALPQVPTVVIEPFSGVRASWRARRIGTRRISMRSWWLWSGFIRSMRRSGFDLYAYTVNDPAKIRHWQQYGLAGVITDLPDRFTDTTADSSVGQDDAA